MTLLSALFGNSRSTAPVMQSTKLPEYPVQTSVSSWPHDDNCVVVDDDDDDDDSLVEKQVQRAVEQPDGHVDWSWSLRRRDNGALLLLLLPSVVWRMPVSALLPS